MLERSAHTTGTLDSVPVCDIRLAAVAAAAPRLQHLPRKLSRVRPPVRWQTIMLMLMINLANLASNCVYSIMDAFFPQQAAAKHLPSITIGAIFAAFPAIVFLSAPLAMVLMDRCGTRCVFKMGISVLAAGTLSFAAAPALPDGTAFAAFCVAMRVFQGFGSALEEAAAYVLVAILAGANDVSFFLGLTELSTGLGYMLGPPLGGLLFVRFGFSGPFCAAASVLLLTAAATQTGFTMYGAAPLGTGSGGCQEQQTRRGRNGKQDGAELISQCEDAERHGASRCPGGDAPPRASTYSIADSLPDADKNATHDTGDDARAAHIEWPLTKLLSEPQILLISIAAADAPPRASTYSLGDHALSTGHANDAKGIGLLFGASARIEPEGQVVGWPMPPALLCCASAVILCGPPWYVQASLPSLTRPHAHVLG
jgi:hypothetical protein